MPKSLPPIGALVRAVLVPCVLFSLGVAPAFADEGDAPGGAPVAAVLMPHVEGREPDDAIERLEAVGLIVHVRTVVGEPAGRVISQDPVAGTQMEPEAPCEIHVGVRAMVQGIVPRLIGMDVDEALTAAAEAYFIEIEEVEGDPVQAGKVLRQDPRPGTQHPIRGRLKLTIVRAPLLVPALLGQHVEVAREQLARLGLRVEVTEVDEPDIHPGTVLAQDPASRSEILAGATVRLRVAAARETPPDEGGVVACPDIVGLAFHDAQEAILAAGLVPHADFETVPSGDHLVVVRQTEPAGEPLPVGEHVHFTVSVLGRPPASTLVVPALTGHTREDAVRILTALGLRARLRHVPSRLPPDTVVGMLPEPGSPISRGSDVVVSLATAPDFAWQPPAIRMPELRGRSLVQARAALYDLGLSVVVRSALAPEAPVDRVADQRPRAGTTLRPGQQVTLVMPQRVRVPNLVGRSFEEAEALLHTAGLRGQGVGAGAGPRRVVSQEPAAGTRIARGSRVSFRWRAAGPVTVAVPGLVGLSHAQALRAAQDAGLTVTFQGNTRDARLRVIGQSVPEGTHVARGTRIQATLGHRAVGTRNPPVPNVLGRSRRDASALLHAAGFTVRVVGADVGMGRPRGRVRTQHPSPGTRHPRGALVTIHLGP